MALCLVKHRDKGKKVNAKLYHAMKTYWGSGDIAPRILHLGTEKPEKDSQYSDRLRARRPVFEPRPVRLWDLPSLLSNDTGVCFSGSKVPGV
jgi:hypothetical protein